jgi:hypothetical protein
MALFINKIFWFDLLSGFHNKFTSILNQDTENTETSQEMSSALTSLPPPLPLLSAFHCHRETWDGTVTSIHTVMVFFTAMLFSHE